MSFGIAKNQSSMLQKKAMTREVLFQREHVIDLVGDPAGFWIFLAIKPYRRVVMEKLGLQGPVNWAREGKLFLLRPSSNTALVPAGKGKIFKGPTSIFTDQLRGIDALLRDSITSTDMFQMSSKRTVRVVISELAY